MMHTSATDHVAASSSVPCPSCGGETSEEFVANGPSKGLRTTCRMCGPIDVLSISVLDLPEEENDDAPAGSPAEEVFRFVEPARAEEPAEVEAPALVDEEEPSADALAFAVPAEPAPEPSRTDPDDDGAESGFSEDASRIIEEAGEEAPAPEVEPNDTAPEVASEQAFEMTPAVVTGRVRSVGPAHSRNRQLALVAIGGVAVVGGLLGLDLYLRPIDPTTLPVRQVPRQAEAAIPAPAEIEPAAVDVAAIEPAPAAPEIEPVPAPASPAASKAAARRQDPAPRRAVEPVAVAKATVPRQEPEVTTTRWYSQTGAPPTRRNAIVRGGLFAERAAAAPAAAPAAAAEPVLARLDEPPAPAPAPVLNPAWRVLRPGMTAQQVVQAIGRPRWKSTSVALEFWMYEAKSIMASGVVVFDHHGVHSWREPSRALPPG